MQYEGDEAKNRKNMAKHGLSFEDAEQVFSGPCVTFEDDRFDYGEERLITLGLLAGRLVVIAHSVGAMGHRVSWAGLALMTGVLLIRAGDAQSSPRPSFEAASVKPSP